ncbi:MAG: 16S rRNA (guanine(527)-N(7))-methyltransferase RsmG [Bdellovibrionales bacterium]
MKRLHRKPEVIFSVEQANDRLQDIFRNHGFGDFPHAQRVRLAEFYHLLMTHQLTDNVTRLTKFRDVAIKHFIDSLIITRHTKLMFPLLDIGTGAGFPGIPLKIMFPNDKIILAEGVKRRVDFLKAVREEMKLENLDIIGRNIDSSFVYPVKGAITRAVEVIGQTLKNVSQSLEIGGQVFLMKGPNVEPEIREAKREWGEYFELVQDVQYDLPKTPHQRRLVVYKKIKTPKLEPQT